MRKYLASNKVFIIKTKAKNKGTKHVDRMQCLHRFLSTRCYWLTLNDVCHCTDTTVLQCEFDAWHRSQSDQALLASPTSNLSSRETA